MDVRYLLLLFFLVSCLPETRVSQGNLSDGTSTQSTGGTTSGTTTIPELDNQWNFLGNLSKTISINTSNLNNAYVVGKGIETFLNTSGNFSQDYCLVSRFLIQGFFYELRTRAVPTSYYDFTAKRTVKLFRVDFNDLTNSQSVCSSAPLYVLDANSNYIPDTTTIATSTFNPALIYPLATSALSSKELKFFKKTSLDLRELTIAQTDMRLLSLSVNPNNNTSTNIGTCSKSECVARGFDCCLDNQCITDGSKRPAALTQYASEYTAAEQERLNNPLAYLNYPHLYYICGTSVPATTTGGSNGSYEQGLDQLKKDYYCVEHMKKYKTGPTFHQDLVSGVSFFPDELDIPDNLLDPLTLYPKDIECRNDTATSSNMYFKKVAERLYQNCGCSRTTLADMVTYCPAYEYSVNYVENSGLPNRIDCYTPPTSANQIPTQQTVSVNSKTAPHRYFRSCGDEFGTNTTCSGGDNQEGDFFEYQDEGQILPTQEDFGMNSILGQMKVTLDKAIPAKMVPVELDQVYLISTTSGFYSPCPTCAKDSWFNSFSAFPTSAYGTGLQAVGHSTSRDAFDYNSTAGNYEDTIFGRACWIPPTMIPFSHNPYSSTQTQRLTRLKTQAALFANGYQRDWYGFNKGALIGSFDGVTWFAVGKGRIVRTTTKKLFLAINAPFADLASPTLHVVNIQAYDGVTQAAQVDYDPQYHLSHPYQNEAGNCQANHFCSTDTDCVTRLGWEYMCASVQDLKTQWPQFDVDGKETQSSSTVLTLDQILHQKRFPSSSTKRCVYRGAGSLCIQTPGTITDLNKRKTLSCAPNFYCANLGYSGPVFNSKISRYASNLQDIPVVRNHLYGKDANVLGRPLSYTASSLTTYLPSDVKTNLIQNMLQYEASASNITGLCLPGKAVAAGTESSPSLNSPYDQHKTADVQGRTDFISQIGGCNSGLFTSYRYSSCPVMGPDGNYEFLSSTYALGTYHLRARNQNSCGLDSLQTTANLNLSADALLPYSPFKAIESKPLSAQTVFEPSFARDACFRRAGQVCHTDLDCGPNKMHADQTENFALAYFGNNAEKKYYSEYLVCGQESSKPSPFDTVAYKAFQMNKNRCCREVGSDLSTFTSFIPKKVNPSSATNTNSSTLDDEYDSASFALKMTLAPGMAPNDPKRYSRLATVENLGTTNRPTLSAYEDRSSTAPDFITTAPGTYANVMTEHQWKTLSEANSESCCGGGWVRKFSDGGNDWTKRDRVYMDVKNFACINSRTTLLTAPADVAVAYNSPSDVQSLVNQDYNDYCKDKAASKSSCAQFTIDDNQADTPNSTTSNYSQISVNTLIPDYGINNPDFYFMPKSADSDPSVIIDLADTALTARRNITLKIPSFISRAAFDNALAPGFIRLKNYSDAPTDTGTVLPCSPANLSLINQPTYTGLQSNPSGTPSCDNPAAFCCYDYNPSTRILKVVPSQFNLSFFTSTASKKKWGVHFVAQSPHPSIVRKNPGTNSYYLRRLGKLELSGIPQITYEALTCSDNSNRVVPGIFKKTGATDLMLSGTSTQGSFNLPDFSFRKNLIDPVRYTNRHALDHEPVFSENDFKCCTPLGKTNIDQTKCCSGFGLSQANTTTYTCALPPGANLMVYFNRFVTNEGVGSDKPGGGLVETDFNSLTGEPLITNAVNQKISALGTAYCANGKVRQGGAFGEFPLEPSGNNTSQSEKIYGIVDSQRDEGQLSNAGATVPVGYSAFMYGFRWNHHLYCDDQ